MQQKTNLGNLTVGFILSLDSTLCTIKAPVPTDWVHPSLRPNARRSLKACGQPSFQGSLWLI